MKWTTTNDYKIYTSANKVLNNVFASSCGSACGAGDDDQPEEKPSVPVKISITQKKEDPPKSAFAKFAFGGDRNE